jgi:hypothetical protein
MELAGCSYYAFCLEYMASYFPSELLVTVLDLLVVEVVYSTLWLAEWTFGWHQPSHSRVEQSAIEGASYQRLSAHLLLCSQRKINTLLIKLCFVVCWSFNVAFKFVTSSCKVLVFIFN